MVATSVTSHIQYPNETKDVYVLCTSCVRIDVYAQKHRAWFPAKAMSSMSRLRGILRDRNVYQERVLRRKVTCLPFQVP